MSSHYDVQYTPIYLCFLGVVIIMMLPILLVHTSLYLLYVDLGIELGINLYNVCVHSKEPVIFSNCIEYCYFFIVIPVMWCDEFVFVVPFVM